MAPLILLGFGPTLLIVGLLVFFIRRAAKSGGSMGALSSFGRTKARRIDPATIRIRSALTEIVDFLLDPARYGRLGGRMPHGVLLSGQPGTGKDAVGARWRARHTLHSSPSRPQNSSRR